MIRIEPGRLLRRSGHDQAIHSSHSFPVLVVPVPGGNGGGRRVHDGNVLFAGHGFGRGCARVLLDIDGRYIGDMRHDQDAGYLPHGAAIHGLLQRRASAIPADRGRRASPVRSCSTRSAEFVNTASGLSRSRTADPRLANNSGFGLRPESAHFAGALLHVPRIIPT